MKRWFCSLDQNFACEAEVLEPSGRDQVVSLGHGEKMAVMGGGTSYTAAAFADGSKVVHMGRCDKVLNFDSKSQIIEAEAGISLGQLFEFLTPKGFLTPVQPGHPQITLGGCIAANVHGKNQYLEGVFCDWVEELRLFHPAHGEMVLSREQNPELFELTCGGYGLTGIILSAKIKVVPLKGNCFEVKHIPVKSLGQTIDLLEQLKDHQDLLYSWNDLARFDDALGRGYLVTGKFTTRENLPQSPTRIPHLDPHQRKRLRLPLLNKFSQPFINAAYYRLSMSEKPKVKDLFTTFFPMWNKQQYFFAYGKGGFIEPQVLVPKDNIHDYLDEFAAMMRRHGQQFGLASLKLFQGRQRLLHYNGEGVSFSLHIGNRPAGLAMLDDMDQLNIRYGARTNLIKDSRLSSQVVRAQYADGFDEFAARLKAFDPKRQWVTALSQRLGL